MLWKCYTAKMTDALTRLLQPMLHFSNQAERQKRKKGRKEKEEMELL